MSIWTLEMVELICGCQQKHMHASQLEILLPGSFTECRGIALPSSLSRLLLEATGGLVAASDLFSMKYDIALCS